MILKNLYQLIKQRLTTNLDANEVAWFYGQYEQNEENHWYTGYGIYIEFTRFPINLNGQGYQDAEVEMRIHLAQACYYDNDDRVTDQAVDHLGKIEELNKTLTGAEAWLSEIPGNENLKGTKDDFLVYNQLEPVELEPDHRFRNVLATIIRYRCNAFERSNVKYIDWRQVNASPKLQK